MPTHARKNIVREGEVACYHVWSRCVQRMWLCGEDPLTGCDYSHRKEWIESLLKYQSRVFALDVGAHHILSNHKHAVLCTRPDLASRWSDEEVAWRWKMAWPQFEAGEWYREPSDQAIEELLAKGPDHLEQLRRRLSSLSWFMARWKEPVARLVNAEADTSGHMWAERFGSRELTNDGEMLVGCLYTDLQQFKCGAVESIEESHNASIQLRLRAWAAQESRRIVRSFERQMPGGAPTQLSPELVEEMLIDSWLMPFSDDSPLLGIRRETAPEPAKPSSPRSTVVSRRSGHSQPTYKIHRKRQPTLWDRMSRQLLEMPRAQYVDIVRQAAVACREEEHDDSLIDAARPPRMSESGTVGRWRASFKQFRKLIYNLAARVPGLRRALARGDPTVAPS